MSGPALRIGRIPYSNLFPIFHMLEKTGDCSSYRFVEDVPSVLNRMLRDGAVDVSPSSSIEYLRHPGLYDLLDGHSISSKGEIGSIFLFSDCPLEELGGREIAVTSQSETSVGLLQVILVKFYGLSCRLIPLQRPEDYNDRPFMLIGDDALIQRKGQGTFTEDRQGITSKGQSNRVRSLELAPFYDLCLAPASFVYDLGELWFKLTGLPFVFALWIARRDFQRPEILEAFTRRLDLARDAALEDLAAVAPHSPMRTFMTEEELVEYWRKIDYGFTDEHRAGLNYFAQCLKEIGVL